MSALTELDYALNCAVVEIDTTNARAELASLRARVAEQTVALESFRDLLIMYNAVDASDLGGVLASYLTRIAELEAALAAHPAPEEVTP